MPRSPSAPCGCCASSTRRRAVAARGFPPGVSLSVPLGHQRSRPPRQLRPLAAVRQRRQGHPYPERASQFPRHRRLRPGRRPPGADSSPALTVGARGLAALYAGHPGRHPPAGRPGRWRRAGHRCGPGRRLRGDAVHGRRVLAPPARYHRHMADRLMRADPAADDAPPPKIDTTVAHIARVYDYWLGGKDHFAVDRAVGEKVLEIHPETVLSVRANRAFLARSVRYLAATRASASSSTSALACRRRTTRTRWPRRPPRRHGWCTSTTTRSCWPTRAPC